MGDRFLSRCVFARFRRSGHLLQRLLPRAACAGGEAHKERPRVCVPPDRGGDQSLKVLDFASPHSVPQALHACTAACLHVCGCLQKLFYLQKVDCPAHEPGAWCFTSACADTLQSASRIICSAGSDESRAPGGNAPLRSPWRCSRTCGAASSMRAPPPCGATAHTFCQSHRILIQSLI